jgi:mannose/fructose-specific phosphotransferase system component IIA
MRTGIVIVSHGESGHAMIDTVERMVGKLDARVVTVPIGEAREATQTHIDDACRELGAEETLFLIDLEGSTPFNACTRHVGRTVILSGVNLPMLFKLATVDREQSALRLAEELRATGMKSIHIRVGSTREAREP